MADNRIYFRCKECGGLLFLGKRLGTGYYENCGATIEYMIPLEETGGE